MKFKKPLSVLLTLFALLVVSCDTWMKDDDLFSDIENDVKVANATKVNVFVRCAMTRQGSTTPSGNNTFKIGIPHDISVTPETEYGFVRWAAFSTSYLDPSTQNKNVIYNDVTSYEENILPNELPSSVVAFENPASPKTKVTIKSSRNDIFIVPLVTQRPSVNLTIPEDRSTNVTRNMAIRINFTKEMDYESLKDAVTVTEGATTIIDDEMVYQYTDITNLFAEPQLSKNKKMLTLAFAQQHLRKGYDQSARVTVTISRDVRDTFGFSMVDDQQITFWAGDSIDSRAPRIVQLTGGWGTDFGKFEGMYSNSETATKLGTNTKVKITSKGSDDASTALDSFYTSKIPGAKQPFIKNRVGKKVTLRVYAVDLNKDEAIGTVNQEKDETAVARVQISAQRLFEPATGSYVGETETTAVAKAYTPKGNSSGIGYTSDYQPSYETLTGAAGFSGDDTKVGCLFDYDLSGLPDGLIKINVAAVDDVGNSGFGEPDNITDVNGNGYASIFVVKDTTPPTGLSEDEIDLTINNSSVDTTIASAKYFNAASFNTINFVPDTSKVQDIGYYINQDISFRSDKELIKWTVVQLDDTVDTDAKLNERLSASDITWKKYDETFTATDGFTVPTVDNTNGIRFAYALKDDMGNIEATFLKRRIKFDCTAPQLGELSWQPIGDAIAGVTTSKVVNNQNLIIPVSDSTSGVKEIVVFIENDAGDIYESPFADSDLTVKANGTTLNKNEDFSISGKKLTLLGDAASTAINQITIKGLKVADNDAEGEYNITVKAYDAANNCITSASPLSLGNDSTLPLIEKIIVPNVKHGKTAADGTLKFYIDYTKLDTSKSKPRTSIYVTFTEANSGVKQFDFDFTTTTVGFTNDTKIYKVSPNGNGFERTGNALVYTKQGNYKFNLKDGVIKGNEVTVEFTDVELPSPDCQVCVRVCDLATNLSDSSSTLYSNNISFTSFSYDSANPYIMLTPALTDNGTDANSVAAETGFTNNKYIRALLYVQQKNSGIVSLTVEGAVFDETTTIHTSSVPTVIHSSAVDIVTQAYPATISPDGSKITFNERLITSNSNIYIIINNLKLVDKNANGSISANLTDGEKTVTIIPQSLGGLEGKAANTATQISKKITVDQIPPQWKDDGLYVRYESESIAAQVYPHPKNNQKVYGLKNIDSANPNDYYFYSNGTQLKLDASYNTTEANLAENFLRFGTGTDFESVTEDLSEGVNGKYAYLGLTPETSGTFITYLVDKAGNKSEPLTFHIVLDSTAQADSTDINSLAELETPTGFDSAKNMHKNKVQTYMPLDMNVYNYYPNASNPATADKILVYNYVLKKFDDPYKIRIKLSEYSGMGVTATSSPIEQYSISHWYQTFSSSGTNHGSDNFKPWVVGEGGTGSLAGWHSFEKGKSFTDGDIISKVESNGDIVITLPQHDCPPISLWIKDACGNTKFIILNLDLASALGQSSISGNQVTGWVIDGEVQSAPETVTLPENNIAFDEVVYYKGDAYLELQNVAFKENTVFASGEEGYSLRAACVEWTGNGTPTPQDLATNAWIQKKAASDRTVSFSRFTIPEPASATQLYMIIEDTVGNYSVTKLKNGQNDKWMYDDQPPVVSVKANSAVKVNYIAADNKNYYSTGASVKYTVSDTGSGVKKDGRTGEDYTTHVTSTPEQDYTLPANPDANGKISITGVEDQLGNGAGTSVQLQNQGSSDWERQETPVITGITASIVAYRGDDVSQNGLTQSDGYTASAPKFKLASRVTRIEISFGGTNTNGLMGWILSDKPKDSMTFNDFYPVSDSIKNTITIQRSGSEWGAKTHYLYAVNKAGLICHDPFVIEIESNIKPVIVNGYNGITYTNIKEYKENNTIKQYYIKSDSSISFTTNVELQSWTLTYGEGNSDKVEHTYTTKTNNIQIDLGTVLAGKTIANANISLILSTGSDESDTPINLKNDTDNKWTYDPTPPAISVSSVKATADGTALTQMSGAYYIKGDNAYITFASDSDTIEYREKNVTAGETSFTKATVNNNVCTITAPADLTEYAFVAVDKADNVSTTPVTVKLQKDTTGPSGTVSYAVYKGSVQASQPSETAPGDYIATVDNNNKKSTIKYNPALVTKLVINGSNISDNIAAVGLPDNFLCYRKSGEQNYTTLEGGVQGVLSLDLGNNQHASGTYYIYAQDKLGNMSDKLWTFELTPYTTAPAANATKEVPFSYLFDDNNTDTNIATYNGTRINGFKKQTGFAIDPDPDPSNQNINQITDTAHQNWIIEAISQNSTISLPIKAKNNLITNKVYYKLEFYSVQHRPASTAFTAPSSGWTQATVDLTKDTDTVNVTVTTQNLVDRNTFIFVWFKDDIGNISVYNIPYPKDDGKNWWTSDTTAPSGSITSYKLMLNDGEVQSGDDTYSVSTSGNVITITYYSDKVNKIEITPSDITDDGVGIQGNGLYYSNNGNLTSFTNTLSLSDSMNGATYQIIAKDKLGNQTTLKTFVFTAQAPQQQQSGGSGNANGNMMSFSSPANGRSVNLTSRSEPSVADTPVVNTSPAKQTVTQKPLLQDGVIQRFQPVVELPVIPELEEELLVAPVVTQTPVAQLLTTTENSGVIAGEVVQVSVPLESNPNQDYSPADNLVQKLIYAVIILILLSAIGVTLFIKQRRIE